jgi:hypothetical protein
MAKILEQNRQKSAKGQLLVRAGAGSVQGASMVRFSS